jgi:DNA-binding CsgD family transcriptional regulator
MKWNQIKPLNNKLIKDENILLAQFFDRYNHSGKSSDFVYDLQLDSCLHISSSIKKIIGHNCEEFLNECILFIKTLIHPEDYSLFLSEFIEFIKTEKDTNSINLTDFIKSFSFRIKHQKGFWVNINLHVLIIVPVKIIGIIQKNTQKDDKGQEICCNISQREIEVLKLIANGNSSKIIGQKLNISENTVVTHRKHLKQKFKVKNTAELIKEAVKAKII